MYILLILCVVAPLLQNGFALNGEETDLNSLSSYEAIDDNDENFEIWNSDDAGMIVFDSISIALLEQICKENSNVLVYITQEDATIDCKVYNQPIDDTKSVVKREAEDDGFEGSGEPPEENVTDPSVDENVDNQETTPEEETSTEKSEESDQTLLLSPTDVNNEDVDTEQNTTELEENKDIVTSTKLDEEEISTESKNGSLEQEASTQNSAVDDMKHEEILPPELETPPPELQTPPPEPQTPPNTNMDKAQEINEKEQPEVDINSDKDSTYSAKKDAGLLKGRTLLDPKTHDENREGLEKADESIKEGESKETTKAGSKDTTILIVLFAAVVVVGAMAFGYNYIKKRKQRSADLEAVERSTIKRSLQNLANGGDEPEKKPLMANNKEVEMVDMKKEDPVPEQSAEKLSSESTVKS